VIPRWLRTWFKGNDTGLSSRTIAWILSGNVEAGECAMGSWGWYAPSDTSDVGRCVRLLDLAAANGEDWRARLGEVAAVAKVWRPLAPAGAALGRHRSGIPLGCRGADGAPSGVVRVAEGSPTEPGAEGHPVSTVALLAHRLDADRSA
jgi:hypothetical protein